MEQKIGIILIQGAQKPPSVYEKFIWNNLYQ